MSILVKLAWSDIPEAEKFEIWAKDRKFPAAQSFGLLTTENALLFYFDGEADWEFRVSAIKFDKTQYRIKHKTTEEHLGPNHKLGLGFNKIPDDFYKRGNLKYGTFAAEAGEPMKAATYGEWQKKRTTPVRIVATDAASGELLEDSVFDCGETFHIPDTDPQPKSRSKTIEDAAKAVEQWWVREGMNRFDGAPACVFQLRRALALPDDTVGIRYTCGGPKNKDYWEGEPSPKPVSKDL